MPEPTNETPSLLRARDVLRIFNIKPRTLYSWHDRGHLRAITLPSGAKRWRQADIDAVLKQGEAQ